MYLFQFTILFTEPFILLQKSTSCYCIDNCYSNLYDCHISSWNHNYTSCKDYNKPQIF